MRIEHVWLAFEDESRSEGLTMHVGSDRNIYIRNMREVLLAVPLQYAQRLAGLLLHDEDTRKAVADTLDALVEHNACECVEIDS